MCIRNNQSTLTKISIDKLAERILSSPRTIFTFITELNSDDYEKLSWYSVVSMKLFDEQTVFIDRCAMDGQPTYNFKLSSYDDNYKEQTEDCWNEIMNGLKKFNDLYGGKSNVWYIKEKYQIVKTYIKNKS